jgi:hypothetical protein
MINLHFSLITMAFLLKATNSPTLQPALPNSENRSNNSYRKKEYNLKPIVREDMIMGYSFHSRSLTQKPIFLLYRYPFFNL